MQHVFVINRAGLNFYAEADMDTAKVKKQIQKIVRNYSPEALALIASHNCPIIITDNRSFNNSLNIETIANVGLGLVLNPHLPLLVRMGRPIEWAEYTAAAIVSMLEMKDAMESGRYKTSFLGLKVEYNGTTYNSADYSAVEWQFRMPWTITSQMAGYYYLEKQGVVTNAKAAMEKDNRWFNRILNAGEFIGEQVNEMPERVEFVKKSVQRLKRVFA